MMRRKRNDRGKKRFGLHSLNQWLHSVEAKCVLVVLAGSLIMLAFFCAASAPERYSLEVGAISHQTITASKDVVDEITTEARRQAAADAVEPSYHLKEGASEQVLDDLSNVFDELRTVQQYGITLRGEGVTAGELRAKEFDEGELDYARKLITKVTLSDYQIGTLLRTETAQYDEMTTSVTTAVENTLNTTIREGQVSQSIQTILQIVGYKVETALFQNIVPVVLRTVIQPNMVIEQEATELARTKAMEAVEPVIYLQGQNIIRDGEIVSRNQLEMLRALGLLEDNTYDLSIYAGGAMLIGGAVLLLMVLLRLLAPDMLHDLRRLSVVMVVMVLSMLVCVIVLKAINVYLAPIAMGAMLLTGLLGAPAGVAGTVALSIIVSSLTAGSGTSFSAEMVHLLIIGLTSGIASVIFLKGKPQRVRVVVSGLLAAVTGLLMMLAIGLMTSTDQNTSFMNAVWAMGGGLLSGILALGFQPVIETMFNLATPSKLLELSNPNQPLLRRLLLEAPGTYHHSIVVANLSEAAAEKVGANPLLARTGAYFHDVGKLKRPLYFKENQMGENPHDHTDPYVSAAIVTTHTRDGLQLAQKYHLPVEIQKIIVEHHGDTPVMFFYHKALQQADGKPVDIADFRYDGTRPSSKESAIVMLADTIEAAVRSMPDPTPQAIERFIERLVRGKLEDGQLSNSPLTLRDIDAICLAFATVLNGVFHERIEYPAAAVPKRDIMALHKPEEEKTEAPADSAPDEGIREAEEEAMKAADPNEPAPVLVQEAVPEAAEASPEEAAQVAEDTVAESDAPSAEEAKES